MDGLHYTVLFIVPLTCLLLDLYMARTCITIMLLLNLLHSSDAQPRPLNDSRTQRVLEGHVKHTRGLHVRPACLIHRVELDRADLIPIANRKYCTVRVRVRIM